VAPQIKNYDKCGDSENVCSGANTSIGTPLIRKLFIWITGQLGPSGKFVENCTKLTCLEITGYRIKYSTVL
jgi:hypothetical protein